MSTAVRKALRLEGLGIILLILFVKAERRNARNRKPSLVRLTLFGFVHFVNGLGHF